MTASKSVIIGLKGGIGNQLFQYAAARSLSLKLKSELILDLAWFIGGYGRSYALEGLNIQASIANKFQSTLPLPFGRVVQKVSMELLRWQKKAPLYREPYFHYCSQYELIDGPIYLDGYFQSPEYFSGFEEVIKNDLDYQGNFPEKCNPVLDHIRTSDAIAIHVRRGDYLSSKKNVEIYQCQSAKYYQEAVKLISSNLKNPRCFIFSDDQAWAEKNLSFEIPFEFVTVNSIDESFWDLMLMSKCKHFIIANSSFSWWSAWLGRDAKKIVVAPKDWFKSNSKSTKDLVPKDWVRL